MLTKLFERDAKEIERIRNSSPTRKSELRKYQDSSGAKAPLSEAFSARLKPCPPKKLAKAKIFLERRRIDSVKCD